MSVQPGSQLDSQTSLRINAFQVFRTLIAAICLMSFLSLAVTVLSRVYEPLVDSQVFSKVIRLLDIDKERSLPTAYSALVLFGCSVLLALIAAVPKLFERRDLRYWQLLSAIFCYLSLDELLSFHETLIKPIRGATGASGVFYFSWVIAAIPCVVAFVIFFFKFWLRLPQQTKRLFLVAMVLFVGGALGVEMINGYYRESFGDNLFYRVLQHIEELMEMIGIAVFFYALLSYISRRCDETRLVLNFLDSGASVAKTDQVFPSSRG